jgi:hypothetical protein
LFVSINIHKHALQAKSNNGLVQKNTPLYYRSLTSYLLTKITKVAK